MTKDFSGMFQDAAMGFATGASRTVTEYMLKKAFGGSQASGYRSSKERGVVRTRKKFSKAKAVNAGLHSTTQCLGILTTTGDTTGVTTDAVSNKHLVSEFNPGTGGFIAIGQDSSGNLQKPTNTYARDLTPMHVYDLNFYLGVWGGATLDNPANFPVTNTLQNDDINSRAWVWLNTNKFAPLADKTGSGTLITPRYYIWDPLGNDLAQRQAGPAAAQRKVYRKDIRIDFTAYGCKQMPTEYDFMIIKILDDNMCPDQSDNLPSINSEQTLQQFQNRWQKLVRPYCINPMLKGVEPGPHEQSKWFTVVARKKVSIPEQISTVDTLPTVRSSLRVFLNETNSHTWGYKGFTTEAGGAAYDNVPFIDDANNNTVFQDKPYYKSRYYLVVRALSPVDLRGTTGKDGSTIPDSEQIALNILDGRTPTNFQPSYDIMIRNSYMNTYA